MDAAGEAVAAGDWPYEVDPGDHFETPAEAYEDVAPLLRLAARRKAKARGRDADGAEARLRLYDPYFCTGRTAGILGGLGFPRVINRRRDFYADIAAGSLPRYDVLVTNPPYSGEHKERLFAYILDRQRLAVARGTPEPFLLLLPSWTAGKALFRRFLAGLAALHRGAGAAAGAPEGAAGAAGGPAGEEELARVFYVCRRGAKGRPSKYNFDSLHGAGWAADCPFFGLWICGGFGGAGATGRALRLAARAWAEGFWEADGLWHPCRPRAPGAAGAAGAADAADAAGGAVAVDWADGTWSALAPHRLAGGRLGLGSQAALEAAGLLRSAEEVRRRQEANPRQRARRQVALEALQRRRAAAREASGAPAKRRRLDRRRYERHGGGGPPMPPPDAEPPGRPAAPGAPAAARPVCRHYFSEQGCSRGDKCRFSHAAA